MFYFPHTRAFFLILLAFTISLNAQTLFFSQLFSQEPLFNYNFDSYPFYNQTTKEHVLFLLGKKQSKIFYFNTPLKEEKQIDFTPSKDSRILGVKYSKENYHLISGSENKNGVFHACSFNSQSKQVNTKEFGSPISGQLLVTSFNKNNDLYCVSVEQNSSLLNIHKLQDDFTWDTWKIDLSAFKFSNSENYYTLFHVLEKKQFYSNEIIDNRTVTSLKLASRKNKVFLDNDSLYISLDHSVNNTHLISMSLENKTYSYRKIPFKKMPYSSSALNSNSFLNGKHFYQLKCSKDTVLFTVRDISTLNILFEQYFLRTDEKYKTFVASLSNASDIAVSAFFPTRNYPVIIGCINHAGNMVDARSASKNLYVAPGGIQKFPPNLLYWSNFQNQNSYKLDIALPPALLQKKNNPGNYFLNIQDFALKLEGTLYGNFLYPTEDGHIYGYCLKEEQKLIIRKFEAPK